MIFVTVGTHNQSFDRLVKKVDEIAENLEEDVIIQRGHTVYKPKRANFFDFASRDKMRQMMKNARVILSHGGAGSIIFALKAKKPLIVVPRLFSFGEHVNDHQLELVQALEEDKRVRAVYDIDDLDNALNSVKSLIINNSKKPIMIKLISNYLRGLDK
jgi:UDP-N-acetylglucosamine transferase subunit ALG13